MDTPPKKRRFWQFHLSTAILFMLAAGGIMWRNAIPVYELIRCDSEIAAPVTITDAMNTQAYNIREMNWSYNQYLRIRKYGWPLQFWECRNAVYAEDWKWLERNSSMNDSDWLTDSNGKLNLAFNLSVWIGCLLFTTAAFEWFLRRREGRKP